MAHGIRCKNCGFQEANHLEMFIDPDDDRTKVYEGRTHSYDNCPGFAPENGEDAMFIDERFQPEKTISEPG